MSRVTIIRTADVWPGEGILSSVRNFLFGLFKGWSQTDERGWRKIWKRLSALEPGEFAEIEFVIPRSLPFHRRHMAIEGAVFDAQVVFASEGGITFGQPSPAGVQPGGTAAFVQRGRGRRA